MKFLVDQQLPPALAAWLRDQAADATHVRDIGLSRATDSDILTWAIHTDAVIVSRDEDFVRLVHTSLDARLVWIRLGNCTNTALIEAVSKSWAEIAKRLEAGERLVELRG